jgi:hypothetical protein
MSRYEQFDPRLMVPAKAVAGIIIMKKCTGGNACGVVA